MRRFDYSWTILTTGFLVLFFSGGSRFAFGLMLKPMVEDLHGSRTSLSLAVTAFMLVSAVAMAPVGRLVDRYSLKWIIGAGVLLSVAGMALMSRVTAPWQVFLAYGVVYAIGHAASSIGPVGVMISRWFERRRGIANSTAVSGNATGQLVIITLLSSFLTSLGWRTSYVALAAANLIIVVPLVFATVRNRRSVLANSFASGTGGGDAGLHATDDPALYGSRAGLRVDEAMSVSRILASRQLWLLVTLYAICGFSDFFVATHVVAFALDQGVATLLAGNMLALMGLMGVLGVMMSGLLADAFGAKHPTLVCFLLRIAVFSLIISFQETAGILVFALLYGFTFLITAPITVIFANTIFGPARLGTVSGIINMVHQVSGGLGAFVGALIFERWGSYDGAFMLLLGLSIVALFATALVRERPIRQAVAHS